jgi:hypothetical protein
MHMKIYSKPSPGIIDCKISSPPQIVSISNVSHNSPYPTKSSYQLLLISMDSISLILNYPLSCHEQNISTQTLTLLKLISPPYQLTYLLMSRLSSFSHSITHNILCSKLNSLRNLSQMVCMATRRVHITHNLQSPFLQLLALFPTLE